jgi:hypothetical protein
MRVARFLLLCLLAAAGIFVLFLLLNRARPREGVQPQKQQSFHAGGSLRVGAG